MSKVRRFDCVSIRTGCKIGLHPDLYCNRTCKRYKKDPQFVDFPGWVQTSTLPAINYVKECIGGAEGDMIFVDEFKVKLQKEIDILKIKLDKMEFRAKFAEDMVKEPEIKVKNKPGRKPKK